MRHAGLNVEDETLILLQIMAPIGMVGFALGAWLSFKLMRRSWLRAVRWIPSRRPLDNCAAARRPR